MDIENLPNNSNNFKDEKSKKVEPVVSNPVKLKKQSVITTRLKSSGNEMVDILWHSLKKTILEMIKRGADTFFDEPDNSRQSRDSKPYDYVSYKDRYRDSYEDRSERSYRISDPNDIIFQSKREAEDVLEKLDETIEVYGWASIGDVFDMCRLRSDNNTNFRYGWKNLKVARVVEYNDGYGIKFPKALPR